MYTPCTSRGWANWIPVAVDRDNALAFRILEQLDQSVVVPIVALDTSSTVGAAMHGEQRVVPASGTRPPGPRRRRRMVMRSRPVRSAITANSIGRRGFRPTPHVSAPSSGAKTVVAVPTPLRAGHEHPTRWIGFTLHRVAASENRRHPRRPPSSALHADRRREPPRRKRHHVHARRVDPLQAIDQQRPVVTEVIDDRGRPRPRRVDGGSAAVRPQQDTGPLRLAGVRRRRRMRHPSSRSRAV